MQSKQHLMTATKRGMQGEGAGTWHLDRGARRGPHRAGGLGAKLETTPWAPDLAGPGWGRMRPRPALTFSEVAEGLLLLGCCVGQAGASAATCSLAQESRAGVCEGEEAHEMSQGLI